MLGKANADIIVEHGHLFTMQGDGVGYVDDGAVVVEGKRIAAVGATADVRRDFTADRIIDATDHAVLPGLIDAHMHTPLALLRGVAQDVGHWMQRGLAPWSRHLTPEAAAAGSMLGAIEALKAGTTTFGDYSFPMDTLAENYARLGVRARLTSTINELPRGEMADWKLGDLYPFDPAVGQEAFEAGMALVDRWHGTDAGRITCMLGPQATDMVSRELLLEIKEVANARGLFIHMHVAQGDREIDQMLKRYGQRTIPWLDDLGYLGPWLLAVHLTEATDDESRVVAQRGAAMALCSGSIGIIDGIVPPARVFREAGGLVALGSDQASGNNRHNIFNEMRLTALFNKILARDPRVMPAWEVLRMATVEGARAIGLDDEVGSLEPGKKADLILVDLRAPNLSPVITGPVRNIVPNLVYAASGAEVDTVIVDGRVLVEDGRVTSVDEALVRAQAQAEADALCQRAATDPALADVELAEAMEKGYL